MLPRPDANTDAVLDILEGELQQHFPGCFLRLVGAFDAGIELSVEYAGVDAPGVALGLVEERLRHRGHQMRVGVVRTEASDVDEICQRVLCDLHPRHNYEHVFGNFALRLHRNVREALDKLDVKSSDTRETKQAKVTQMKALLFKYEKKLFRDGRKGFCLMHRCECSFGSRGGTSSGIAVTTLRLHIAGTTCKDASAMNRTTSTTKTRDVGPHAKILLIWCMERRERLALYVLVFKLF